MQEVVNVGMYFFAYFKTNEDFGSIALNHGFGFLPDSNKGYFGGFAY